ncbi:MAG: hypothetical protein AAF458_13675 [Pseudomonadota bacterium]
MLESAMRVSVWRTFTLGLVLGTLLSTNPGVARAQENIEEGEVRVGGARAQIRIVPNTVGPRAGQLKRRLVDVRVARVVAVTGNNPTNQRQPVNNFNGQEFTSLSDTITASQGGLVAGGGQGLDNCVTTVSMKLSGTAPANFRFASFDIDPNTGSCVLVADGSTGSALIVQTPPNGANPGQGEAFPDASVGLFTQVSPAGTASMFNNTPITVTVRATNGFTVAITITLIPKGGNEFDLQVTSVVQV